MFRQTIFILIALLASNSAEACRSPMSHVIFNAPPIGSKGAEFVGKVDVRLKRRWLVVLDASHGLHGRVLASTTHPQLVGKNIEVPRIFGTSCGPHLRAGHQGYIFGAIEPSETAAFKVRPQRLIWHPQFENKPSNK